MGVNQDDIKFGRFNCKIVLTKAPLQFETYSKIKMNCAAYSSDKNEKLQCDIIQDVSNLNTFTIRVKRSKIDDRVDDSRPKRFKMIANQPAIAVSAGSALK